MTPQPLLKLLTGSGIGSRRRMAEAIKRGGVAVNGEVVEDFRREVNEKTDRVTIDGKQIAVKREPPVYLALNKPKGVLSTTSDDRGRRTVLDIIPKVYGHLRLYPVGRLDKDSTGLLLLTNDGEIAHRLTHPSFEQEKEYYVQIEGSLSLCQKRKLTDGLSIDDAITSPATIREVSSRPPYNYSITIHEGRKRQVRRMFDALGHYAINLKRVRMGDIHLGDLKEGETRELSAGEVRIIKEDKSGRRKQ